MRNPLPFSASIFHLALLLAFQSATMTADANIAPRVDWNWPSRIPTRTLYHSVDILNASWTSDLDHSPILVIWCRSPSGWTANETGVVPSNGTHLVSLDLRLPQPYPVACHLDFSDQSHKQIARPSSSFNISDDNDPTPQIWSGDSSSASVTAHAAATSSGSSRLTGLPSLGPSTQSAAASNSSSGISGGAIAGIVVGVIVGVGLIIGALVFLAVRRRRRRSQINHTDGHMATQGAREKDPQLVDIYGGGSKAVEKDSVQLPVEAPAETTEDQSQGPVELEGNQTFIQKAFSRRSEKSVNS